MRCHAQLLCNQMDQSILQLTKSQRYSDTHAGEIKQTGVNTTQDGTTRTIEELQWLQRPVILS